MGCLENTEKLFLSYHHAGVFITVADTLLLPFMLLAEVEIERCVDKKEVAEVLGACHFACRGKT